LAGGLEPLDVLQAVKNSSLAQSNRPNAEPSQSPVHRRLTAKPARTYSFTVEKFGRLLPYFFWSWTTHCDSIK